MIKQCSKLLAINLLKSFGINEVIYTKDNKKKVSSVLLGFCFLLVGFSMVFYIGISAYSLCYIGAADIVPAYMLALTSLIILFFTMLKTNGVIFQKNHYDMLAAMPIKPAVIVASRFLNMYVGNVVFSMLVMVPSCFVYAIYARASITFFIMTAISIIVLPLIPMTIATTIGSLITVITSRMRFKNFFTVVLSIAFALGIIVVSSFTGSLDSAGISNLANIVEILTKRVNELYPLAPLFTSALVKGNWFAFLVFVLVSILVFALFVAATSWKFVEICSLLNDHVTKSNYQLKELEQNTPLKALYIKELKRYFSSNLYVLNTIIGYVMMVAMAVAILVMGVDEIEKAMEMPGVVQKAMPLLMSIMCGITSTTISSISLEGKQWWIPKSLPVSTKTIFDSKILVNLTLAIPSSIIASVLLAIAVPFEWIGYVWLFLTPIVYNLFFSVFGIFINAQMPVFNWDNEATVIKQSGAVFVGMLVGMGSVMAPLILVVIANSALANLLMGIVTVIIAILTVVFYKINNQIDLRRID